MNIVLKNLLALMEERRVNARQLQLHFGLSNSAVTKWKTRNAYPNLELLERIAEFFGVDVAYFYDDHSRKITAESASELSAPEVVELMNEIGLTRERLEGLDEEKKKLLIAVVNAFFEDSQK